MNRGRSPGTTRARSGSALALLCAASAVAWGLPAFPASAQVPPDTAPSFGTTTVVDQAYTATVDIGSLELPAATGGNGALTYALALACASGDEGTAQDCGLPSGLTFDADDRELAGTPDTPGTYRMEYKVTDADDNTAAGDADTLNFTITVATAVPGPPGNLAAEARPGTVKLTWDLPAHTGASKIIRHEYRYEVFGVDPSPWITMASSAPGGTNATSFNVGELTPARLYSFWVRAVNGAGGGPESGKVTVLTKSPEPPSGKNLNISKEFTDNPVVAGRGVGARTATLQFSVTNTHLTEDATDVKYTDNVHDMLSGATLDTSQATRALRCVRYDGTDVSGDCDNTSSENYRECGTRIWAGTTPVQIQWWDGFTVPARSTCYATDVVNIPADAATGSYVNTSGAVTGKYGETSVTGGTATDTLRVRANDQPVRVEKWFSGTRNTGILNSDGAYNHGTLEFNYQITNPNPTARARVEFTEDFTAFVERFKDFPASDLESRYTYLYLQPPEWTGCSRPTVSFPTRGQDKYGTFSFSIDPSSRIPSDNGSCTFKVRLQIPRGAETTDGIYVNAADTYTATTKSIKTTLHGNDTPLTTGDVSASVTIIKGAAWKLLQFTKAFGPPAVASAGGTVDLTYTLTNPNQQRFATDITFEHDLTEFISGAVATSVPARPCGDDSAITLENGNKRLRFSSERLHARNTCTFTVAISIPAGTNPGTYTSTTRRGSYTMEELFKGVQASVLPAISADVLVPAVPAAPTDFTAVPGDQQVTLGWTAPADTGGTDVEITGYEYSQDGGDNWTDTGATSTSHVVEALSNGTEYVFRVRARNVSGAGTPTANLEAAPRPVLTISDADVEEGNADATNMTFTVTQSATSTKPVKVEYKTADPSDASLERATAGEDYDDVSDGTLTFSANTTGDALTKTVSVKVRGDTLKENDEHFAVVLHTPDNAHIQDSEGVGKITNDDENTAPSFGTATVDDQTEVAHITMEELELPAATGGNGTLTYALACASGRTGWEDTPALAP
ncbi:MAG: fibronectin type III domain-containing protein, partial [Rhodospirillales bacterium]|nr:fibronectin type III domain-containing protein [Rhodospirillales bacterium]